MDFSWKLTYLAIWFVNATGSLFLDMGLIQDNLLMVFTKINNGKSLMHYICQKNAHIDLKRLLKAIKIYYSQDKERTYLKLFDIGDDVCLDTPAHLCLIH